MTALPKLKPHPAADLFPMMSESEIDELAADIRQRGQVHPIIVTTGHLVLDGRNRLEACRRAGVEPYMLMWDQEDDPTASATAFVLSANLRRRHLNDSQRALVAAEALPMFEAEAKRRMSAGGKKAKGAPRGAPLKGSQNAAFVCEKCNHESERWLGKCPACGTWGSLTEWPGRTAPAAKPSPPKKQRASEKAAAAVGASSRSVERAKAVLSKRPDLREQIRAGKQSLKQVEKAIRKEEQLKNVLAYRPPNGTYSVIVADPSWKYKDQLDGSDQARGGTTYPPMELEEICAMQIGKTNAAPDCALWLWVTKDHLMDGSAAKVLEAWGFEGKQIYTWRKVDSKGNDRMGTGYFGRNVTEFIILAVRGKPLVQGADQPNIFDAPRTSRHSEKPARFFEIAEKVTPCAPEARIELFAIGERKGWVVSGSEQQATARAGRPRRENMRVRDVVEA